MVRQKSYSETDGERTLARYMVEKMREIGLDAELQPVEGERVNAIGRLREGWTVDPWGGLVDDKFIYGIGVSNMKAGDAAYYWALKTLVDNGVKLKGDVILTYVVGELQGGIGTLAAIRQGIKADYFINSEPTDLQAVTMHAAAFTYVIELTGKTRHLSKREEAVDAIAAACELIPELNAMTFSGAPSDEHLKVNRMHVGVVHGALGRELHEWRSPQVADFARIKGSGRYGPGQTEQCALADIRKVLDGLEARRPGITASIRSESQSDKPLMPPFQVPKTSRIVQVVNAAYEKVRGTKQPTGPLPPPAYFGTDAGHFYKELNMEGIVCGPGGRYNTMPDERVDIVDFIDMIKVYMLAILAITEPVV
jgi:acetylornithine deacetylase